MEPEVNWTKAVAVFMAREVNLTRAACMAAEASQILDPRCTALEMK
jgi:hypothetical protein